MKFICLHHRSLTPESVARSRLWDSGEKLFSNRNTKNARGLPPPPPFPSSTRPTILSQSLAKAPEPETHWLRGLLWECVTWGDSCKLNTDGNMEKENTNLLIPGKVFCSYWNIQRAFYINGQLKCHFHMQCHSFYKASDLQRCQIEHVPISNDAYK